MVGNVVVRVGDELRDAGIERVEAKGLVPGSVQGISAEIVEHAAMKIVRAALGPDVEHTAHGAAVLSFIAGGLELELLQGVGANALIVETGVHAGGVDAVDVEDVLGAAGAIDRNSAGKRFTVYAGHIVREQGEITAPRETQQLLRTEV